MFGHRKRAFGKIPEGSATFYSGGVGGIRTHARVTPSNDLANRPLQPLEYHSVWLTWIVYTILIFFSRVPTQIFITRPLQRCCKNMAERVGFEPTEACTSLVFKTRALNHSTTSPCYFDIIRQICLLVKFQQIPLECRRLHSTPENKNRRQNRRRFVFYYSRAYALPAKRL